MTDSSTEHLIPLHIKQAIDNKFEQMSHRRISAGDAEDITASYIVFSEVTAKGLWGSPSPREVQDAVCSYTYSLVRKLVVKEKPRFVSKGSISALLAISFFAGVLVSSLFVTEMGKKILSHLGNF